MKNLKRLILVIFLLLLVAAVLIFVLENQQSASLVFLGWALPSMPLAVFVVFALLIGLAVGPVLMYFRRLFRRKAL